MHSSSSAPPTAGNFKHGRTPTEGAMKRSRSAGAHWHRRRRRGRREPARHRRRRKGRRCSTSSRRPCWQQPGRRGKESLGAEDGDTVESLSNLAVAYRAAGRLAEAIALGEEALRLRQAKLGPTDPQTLITMCNLARAYQGAGRLAEAIALHEKALT